MIAFYLHNLHISFSFVSYFLVVVLAFISLIGYSLPSNNTIPLQVQCKTITVSLGIGTAVVIFTLNAAQTSNSLYAELSLPCASCGSVSRAGTLSLQFLLHLQLSAVPAYLHQRGLIPHSSAFPSGRLLLRVTGVRLILGPGWFLVSWS